ncbi:hypothetical protein [Streptomyces sp. NPDC048338]|uniref:hypothetical protein n=1 Tax=Streptomyces sp. NPDC048338 TaxID=3365536 RepID=UPI00371BEF9E
MVGSRSPRCDKRAARLSAAVFPAVDGVDLADLDRHRAYALVIDVAGGTPGDIPGIARRLREL